MRAESINTELHNEDGEELYALCIPNDVTNPKVQQWQFAVLKTAKELIEMLGIPKEKLPYGVRWTSQQFHHLRTLRNLGDDQKSGLEKHKEVKNSKEQSPW